MPFKRAFERNLNREMQQEGQGQAPRDREDGHVDIKKQHRATNTHDEEEEDEDIELSEKKERPPRFSTLFGGAPAPVIIERDSPRRSKNGGVFIPMPLFILLAIILFLESTFLFAYTIIGLYNNRPAGLVNFGSSSAPLGGYCADRQAGINIAPNFIMPQGQLTVTVTKSGGALIIPETTPNALPTLGPLSEAQRTIPTGTKVVPLTKVTTISPTSPAATATLQATVAITVSDGSTITVSTTTASPSSPLSSPTTLSSLPSLASSATTPSAFAKQFSSLKAELNKPIALPTELTTASPTATKETKTTSKTSTASTLPSTAGLDGCLAGKGSIECQVGKNVVPPSGDVE